MHLRCARRAERENEINHTRLGGPRSTVQDGRSFIGGEAQGAAFAFSALNRNNLGWTCGQEDARRSPIANLGFQRFPLAAGMVALADEFRHALGILTILAAIRMVFRCNTATGGVRTLLGFAHTFSL